MENKEYDTRVFIAEFNGGNVALNKAMAKGTDKLWKIKDKEVLIGYTIHVMQLPREGHNNPRLFFDGMSAVIWLHELATDHVAACRAKLEKAQKKVDLLADLIRENNAKEETK